MKDPILLVDDDDAFRRVYASLLRDAGHSVDEADDRVKASAAFGARGYPVVILDLMLPPDGSVAGGLAQLSELLGARPECKIIVASGAGDEASMIRAVKSGAFDFLTKPVDPDVLLIVVERALARVELESRLGALESQLSRALPEGTMIGESLSFRRATELAERVAGSDLPVLITGENGTGKELLARAIHGWSPRRDKKLVPINCGAIPETLLESTFFGHEKGAFTGAVRDHRGLLAEANGGTLFLDEVGDMPASMQVKLLRALESGEYLPVGASEPRRVDLRIVSATHRDLDAQVAKGELREDLYWRIKGAEVRLPPLRERSGDLPLLARYFLNRAAHLTPDGKPRVLSDAAADALAQHAWPGNLRELRHEMQRATVLAGTRVEIQPEDLSWTGADRPPPRVQGTTTLPEKIEALERREISEVLARHSGNRSRTAQELGLSRQGLLKKMERYGIG
ncbi:MAG: sigma-54-dependent Fis family transcriptional regulator [Deltaproteobacteria bacterium]|nr:sigma-54-dependent Fis family transcriptional regulator [Deltaproteobacteria bacterium]